MQRLAKIQEQTARRQAFALGYGDMVLYRGKKHPITAADPGRIGPDGERFCIPPDLTPAQIKAACTEIYRAQAAHALAEKVSRFADLMHVAPTAVKITGAKSRWGSCSSRKSISFAWRLIMAEDSVIDYVVVHELAHITEMNHSKRFWSIVEVVLPDYRQRREKLKELQNRLSEENWD